MPCFVKVFSGIFFTLLECTIERKSENMKSENCRQPVIIFHAAAARQKVPMTPRSHDLGFLEASSRVAAESQTDRQTGRQTWCVCVSK